ncbi:MAG TPA: transcriptional regulator [Streptosporangiaceae bacterium]|nr:transcriptional regulator [Streptosporangiaceae bacterium]
MAYVSAADDLALHGARILGFATASRIAGRFGLDTATTSEYLLDFEACGWVGRHSFAGTSGWSLTEAGRAENERRLADELDKAGSRETVARMHAAFLPLNQRLGTACTNWQIRPAWADPMAMNDHTDWRWDERVLRELAALDTSFRELCGHLTACLQRFSGYADLYSGALRKAETGQRAWVDAPDRDSCHTVWIQFHEDLLATLGIPRGSDTGPAR